jgi:hypothetical protein
MKVSREFQEMLWEYSSHVVSVIGRQQREREPWMGSREDDYVKCEAAFTKLTKMWEQDAQDLEALRVLHRAFLDNYEQGRPDEGRKLLKEIDGLIFDLRVKWGLVKAPKGLGVAH